jgi:hypothetical protein
MTWGRRWSAAAVVALVLLAGCTRSGAQRAWRPGAAGERRTARLLAPLERRGWAVLHDLAIPGTQANIDHVVIGPGGVLVIDSKQYRGRLHLDQHGMAWHGHHLLVAPLRKTRWQADQADEVLGIADITVAAIVAIHGTSVPWGRAAGRWGHHRPRPPGTRPPAGIAADAWARAGGLAGRPSPAAVPRRRLTACTTDPTSIHCLSPPAGPA